MNLQRVPSGTQSLVETKAASDGCSNDKTGKALDLKSHGHTTILLGKQWGLLSLGVRRDRMYRLDKENTLQAIHHQPQSGTFLLGIENLQHLAAKSPRCNIHLHGNDLHSKLWIRWGTTIQVDKECSRKDGCVPQTASTFHLDTLLHSMQLIYSKSQLDKHSCSYQEDSTSQASTTSQDCTV